MWAHLSWPRQAREGATGQSHWAGLSWATDRGAELCGSVPGQAPSCKTLSLLSATCLWASGPKPQIQTQSLFQRKQFLRCLRMWGS